MPAHPFAIDRVEIFDGLLWRKNEIVADILDRDLYAELLGHGDRFFDLHDRALETLLIADAVAGDARDEEHARSSVGVGVVQAVEEPVEPQLAGGLVGRGQRLHPVNVVAHARGL